MAASGRWFVVGSAQAYRDWRRDEPTYANTRQVVHIATPRRGLTIRDDDHVVLLHDWNTGHRKGIEVHLTLAGYRAHHPEASRHAGEWREWCPDGWGNPEHREWWECDWCSQMVFDGGSATIDSHLAHCPDREIDP